MQVTIRRIEEAGGRPLGDLAPRSWGESAAWFADPDGNVFAVAQSVAVESPA
jgi:predicted enzyme related to lactoylglutathione lyase